MISERHTRGKVFEHVEICPNSYLSKGSQAHDRADIWESELNKCRVRNDAVLRKVHATNVTFDGGIITDCRIIHSQILKGRMSGAFIATSVIDGGYIRGDSRFGVTIKNSTIKDDALVQGIASIEGIT